MKRVAVLAMILFVVPYVMSIDFAAPPIAYCQHMGYSIDVDSEGNPLCLFDDGSSCSTYKFYVGECGQDKVKEIEPRKEGETVYIEFEECAEGLIPSEKEFLLDIPVCEKRGILGNYLPKVFQSILSTLHI